MHMLVLQATTTTGRVGRKTLLIQRKSCGRGGKEGYELVKESMVIWEHLRQHDNVPSRTLALEEMMTMAQGHFKEVSLHESECKGWTGSKVMVWMRGSRRCCG